MALLVPEDLSLDGLPSSERWFVQRMRADLSDDWLMIPQCAMTTTARDFEVDVVMVNQHHGVIDQKRVRAIRPETAIPQLKTRRGDVRLFGPFSHRWFPRSHQAASASSCFGRVLPSHVSIAQV